MDTKLSKFIMGCTKKVLLSRIIFKPFFLEDLCAALTAL